MLQKHPHGHFLRNRRYNRQKEKKEEEEEEEFAPEFCGLSGKGGRMRAA